MQLSRRTLLASIATGLLLPARAQSAGAPVVAAAANMRFCLEAIVETFTRATGNQLRISFGSSGNLARQIIQGAPYELFLSADEASIELVRKHANTQGLAVRYARGRLALIAAKSSPLAHITGLSDLRTDIANGTLQRFAIANPKHAPYGRAAQQALQASDLWAPLQGRLAHAENVAQATQFVASGAAQAGLVAQSLTYAPRLRAAIVSTQVPEILHKPLHQAMTLLKDAGPVAAAFFDFMQSPPARAMLQANGYALPQRRSGRN